MPPPPEQDPPFDLDRILETLARHRVEYLLVGGVAAGAHGAQTPTYDFDCLAGRTRDNLVQLGAAMRELNARLRAEGLDDDVARSLPTRIDPDFLAGMEISTWRTDAGDFDVLTDIPDRSGTRVRYDELKGRSVRRRIGNVQVRVARLEDIIASKEWANRPKDLRALPELRSLLAQQQQEATDRHQRDPGAQG